jgi:hypothetical protein
MSLFSLGGSYNSSQQSTNTSGTTSNQTTNDQTGSNTSQNTNTQTGLQQAIQDPMATNFRHGLFSQYDKAINGASSPIYGTGFVAGQQGLNATAAAQAQSNLKDTLASTGQLDSGALGAGASGIAVNQMNQNAQLQANLPAMEAQAQSARLDPLLAGGSALAGQAPTSYSTTGTQVGTAQSQSTLNDIINQIIQSSLTGSGKNSGFGISGGVGR